MTIYLHLLGQCSVMATLLKGNNYIPEQNFFVTSVNEDNPDPIYCYFRNKQNRNLVLSVLEKLNENVDEHYLSDENKILIKMKKKPSYNQNTSCWSHGYN